MPVYILVLCIPLLAISCGLFAVIGSTIVRPWLAHREKRMEIEAQMVADRACRPPAPPPGADVATAGRISPLSLTSLTETFR